MGVGIFEDGKAVFRPMIGTRLLRRSEVVGWTWKSQTAVLPRAMHISV